MKIETERLYIRHFVNEDASICFEGWGTDEHLGDFIMGYPMNMDQMNSFVNAMVKNTNAWVIVENESGEKELVGYKPTDRISDTQGFDHFEAKFLYFPIPQAEVDANLNLEQKPEWR